MPVYMLCDPNEATRSNVHALHKYPSPADPNVLTTLYLKSSYEGAVLSTTEEEIPDGHDFIATVWDDTTKQVREIVYASTSFWSYPNFAIVDAHPHTRRKAAVYTYRNTFWLWCQADMESAKMPSPGKMVQVVRSRRLPAGTIGPVVNTFVYQNRLIVQIGTHKGAVPTDAENVRVLHPQLYCQDPAQGMGYALEEAKKHDPGYQLQRTCFSSN